MKRWLKRISLFVLGLILLAGVGGYLWLNPGRGPREQVDPEVKGWSEDVDGALVLHLKGSPYEMGYQRGYFARDKVKLNIDLFEGLLKLAEQEVGLPRIASNLILDITYAALRPLHPRTLQARNGRPGRCQRLRP